VRTDLDAVRRARQVLDELEATWRARVDRMARLLAHDDADPAADDPAADDRGRGGNR